MDEWARELRASAEARAAELWREDDPQPAEITSLMVDMVLSEVLATVAETVNSVLAPRRPSFSRRLRSVWHALRACGKG